MKFRRSFLLLSVIAILTCAGVTGAFAGCEDDTLCVDLTSKIKESCRDSGDGSTLCAGVEVMELEIEESSIGSEEEAVGKENQPQEEVKPACLMSKDCIDDNYSTLDTCNRAGTESAVCTNTKITLMTIDADVTGDKSSINKFSCRMNSECDDGDSQTINVCYNPDGDGFFCGFIKVECTRDSDCKDRDPATMDKCRYIPGDFSVMPNCSHISIIINEAQPSENKKVEAATATIETTPRAEPEKK